MAEKTRLFIPQTNPFFIVATAQEAELVSAAGYTVIVAAEHDPANVAIVSQTTENVGTALIVLDMYEALLWSDTLAAAGVPHVMLDGAEYAGAFEAASSILHDKTALETCLKRDFTEALEVAETARAEAWDRMLTVSHGVYSGVKTLEEVKQGHADREKIPTGLEALDDLLDGGLPTGALVTMGALSSMGKTSICNQIADNVAEAGRPVLIVSCEQSRHELAAMSISRLTRLIPSNNGGAYIATADTILSAKGRATWGEPLKRAVEQAEGRYLRSIAPNKYVMEPDKQPTAKGIRAAAEAIRKGTGVAPHIYVDYLQLLAPPSERMDERLAVNENVSELRKLAKDLNTNVFVISALSRASLKNGVTMDAFRESSGIEYSSDILLGLQPAGMTERLRAATEAKRHNEALTIIDECRDKACREVEVRVLKNRGGRTPKEGAAFTFFTASRYFKSDVASKPGKFGEGDRLVK